jgi:hypothetical protein
MDRRQGRRFSEKQTETIRILLATTDMTIGEIAKRMGCSSGAIASINRKVKIRQYDKKRSSWALTVENDPAVRSNS